MDLSFIDLKTTYTILHLMGVAIGAGGAFAGDFIFFQCLRDGRISKEESGFIKNSSRMVWLGLFILIVSGTGLFLLNPETYMSSSKFISKMIVVLIIALNGIVFHILHIPKILASVGKRLKDDKDFMKNRGVLFASGAISFISWFFAIVFGALRGIPYSTGEIMSFYFIVVLVGVIVSQIMGRIILR